MDIYYNEFDNSLDYDGDSTDSLNSFITCNSKKQKNILDNSKKADKGYYRLKKKVNNTTVKIEFYNSGNILGRKIRDPVYGSRLPEKIGSNGEHLYFKVRYTGINSKDPITLFYDSPQDFERHFKETIPTSIKTEWMNKRNLEIMDVNKDEELSNENMIMV